MRRAFALAAGLACLLVGCRNKPPSIPIVMGLDKGRPGDSLWFTAQSVDADGDSIAYLFNWGDGQESQWSSWFPSGEKCPGWHAFTDSGIYGVLAKAQDLEHESEWSDSFLVEVRDFGPFTPQRPSGPDTVAVGDTVLFISAAGHPLGEWVALQFDWGDTLGDWTGFARPGSTVKARHAWGSGGIFEARARAKDSLEHLSGWSKPESVWVVDSF